MILGIELTNNDAPQIWFPNGYNSRKIIIQITEDCLYDMNKAIYQVAHETIHCLTPSPIDKSNFLEEGTATMFAIQYCIETENFSMKVSSEKYKKAMDLVISLLQYDNDIIKKLRLIQPRLSLVDSELILQVNKNVPLDLANELTEKF